MFSPGMFLNLDNITTFLVLYCELAQIGKHRDDTVLDSDKYYGLSVVILSIPAFDSDVARNRETIMIHIPATKVGFERSSSTRRIRPTVNYQPLDLPLRGVIGSQSRLVGSGIGAAT